MLIICDLCSWLAWCHCWQENSIESLHHHLCWYHSLIASGGWNRWSPVNECISACHAWPVYTLYMMSVSFLQPHCHCHGIIPYISWNNTGWQYSRHMPPLAKLACDDANSQNTHRHFMSYMLTFVQLILWTYILTIVQCRRWMHALMLTHRIRWEGFWYVYWIYIILCIKFIVVKLNLIILYQCYINHQYWGAL